MSEREIRLEAIRYAAQRTALESGIASLLIHAGWIERFIQTGVMPEVDRVLVNI